MPRSFKELINGVNVFVGQVGYWLPWDPNADQIEDEAFISPQLNDMMEKYKENNINKDIFYEEQKREKVKAAKEEAMKKKERWKKNALLKKQRELEKMLKKMLRNQEEES